MYKRGDAIWRLEKKLNNLENQKKITQTELASVLKTTKQNIYKYETGINLNICVVHYHLLQLAQYEWSATIFGTLLKKSARSNPCR